MNIAVVLAGGTGSRMGSPLPKQFLQLNGRMVIEYPIDTFQSMAEIDEICIVMHPNHLETMRQLALQRQWSKLRHIVAGGAERYLSTAAALSCYANSAPECRILFHDAARPLVSPSIISRTLQALDVYQAAGVAIACVDTVWQLSAQGTLLSVPQRSSLRNAQTPQGFHLGIIRQAYQAYADDLNRNAAPACTDDCSVLLRYCPDIPIAVVEGEPANLKVTTPADLDRLEAFLQKC